MGRDSTQGAKVDSDSRGSSLMQIWLNDGLVDATTVGVALDGWPDGEGIFETIKTQDGQIFELGRHMRRALDAADRKGISLPGEELIRSAISNLLSAEPHPIGRLRLLFSANRFVAVHQLYEEITNPAKLMVTSDSDGVDGISIKAFPYTDRLDLLSKVQAKGFDEVICLNPDLDVTEGAVSNFIFRIEGTWVTSPLSSGVLPGVQRAIAIERCGVSVSLIKKEDLSRVEAAFVISSLKIALSVSEIDGRSLEIDEDCAALEADMRAKTLKHSVG
jgi:branched-chain amino acid aminotransferase